MQILMQMEQCKEYTEPDASALRLKITLVTLDSPVKTPWELVPELFNYIYHLREVSVGCRLTDEEDRSLGKGVTK